jgi:hypothetical protein
MADKNPGQVSAYLDDWTLGQVQAYAKSEDRSVSWVIGFAVKQFMTTRAQAEEMNEWNRRSTAAAEKPSVQKLLKLANRVHRGPKRASKPK